MSSPLLIIRRVVVSGELSCDYKFDRGLHIMQGVSEGSDQRSSQKCGKTGLVELIQHGLGRAQKSQQKFHFKPVIDQIKTLWLEIEANGNTFTIQRSLQELFAQVTLREGPYVQGIESLPGELIPLDELSGSLLRLLDIPEVNVKTEKGDLIPLSFPTLMRAFILHQEDSFREILDKVQPDQRRADILGFISGVTPINRFTIEGKLSEAQKETQRLESYYASVQSFLVSNSVPTLIEAQGKVLDSQESLDQALVSQRNLQLEIRENTLRAEPSKNQGRLESLQTKLIEIKQKTDHLIQHQIGLQQEKDRLEELVGSLEDDMKKARRLKSSTSILSSVEFGICPRCLSDVTEEMKMRELYARCSLCNRPIRSTSDAPPRRAPNTDDIALQITEIHTILEDINKESGGLAREITGLQELGSTIGNTIDKESQAYVSPSVDHLLARAHDVSQKEADLARAQGLLEQALALEAIREELNDARRKQSELEDQLRVARKPNQERINALREIYEQVLIDLDFPEFRECSISPYTLMPNINGNLYVHTGMAFKGLATVAYHLALLELSRIYDTFFPRLLVIDSPAIGDLNNESHDKLLKYFAKIGKNVGVPQNEEETPVPDWQILLTTRRMVPELLEYPREEISSPHNMLLKS